MEQVRLATAALLRYLDERTVAIATPDPDPQTGVVPIQNLGARGGEDHDNVDIAWIEIARGVAPLLRREFVQVSQLRGGYGGRKMEIGLAYGFPAERSWSGQQGVARDGWTSDPSDA